MGIFNDEINAIFTGSGERGPPRIGFALTSSGDFDIKKSDLHPLAIQKMTLIQQQRNMLS